MGSAWGGAANKYWYAYIEFSVNNGYSATQAAVGVTLYMYFRKGYSDGCNMAYNSTSYVQADGQTAGISSSWNHAPSAGDYVNLGGHTFVVDKTHAARTISTVGALGRTSGFTALRGSSTAVGYDTVAAKTNYAVQYNGNGGTGEIANSTKWYGENLTLSYGTGFTRAHHTLTGWNTAADGTGTHYDLGGTYTENAATTLYAEWHLNAVEARGKDGETWRNGIYYARVGDRIVIPHLGFTKIDGTWKKIIKE